MVKKLLAGVQENTAAKHQKSGVSCRFILITVFLPPPPLEKFVRGWEMMLRDALKSTASTYGKFVSKLSMQWLAMGGMAAFRVSR